MANSFIWAASSIYLLLFRSGHWVRVDTPADAPGSIGEASATGVNGVKNVFPAINHDTGNVCDVDENEIVYRELITTTPTQTPNQFGVVMPVG